MKLIPTPDGAYTFQYQGRYVHSTRAPLKEASKLIANIERFDPDNTLVIAWGTGLGYHIDLLLDKGYQVLAVEFRPEVAELFSQNFDTSRLLGFIKNPKATEIFDFLIQCPHFDNFADISMLGLAVPAELFNQKTQALTAKLSLHTIKSTLMESWYLNIIQNIKLLQNGAAFFTFDKIFAGQNLVICSAGPSLKESLPHLKKQRKNITLLAVDTALLTLLQADIVPDYVYSVDTKIHNIFDFRFVDCFDQIKLIADISLSHQILKLGWKEVLLVSTSQPIGGRLERHGLQQYLWDEGIRFPETQTGGSVATSAFHLALIYGAEHIYLTGQDLAYSNNSFCSFLPYIRLFPSTHLLLFLLRLPPV